MCDRLKNISNYHYYIHWAWILFHLQLSLVIKDFPYIMATNPFPVSLFSTNDLYLENKLTN